MRHLWRHSLSAVWRGGEKLDALLNEAVDGPNSLFARREIIDEYGWRNYGEVYADHENAHSSGPKPIISHYNNQYDVIYGMLLQFFRSGDPRWWDLADPLARHVIDIDVYHTKRDKAAYSGGLFWHTDHYRDAATCTHRAYSKANVPLGRPYGGGPSCEHNYTTGLLYYHYLTGDPLAREAVLELAGWVLRMDDGTRNILGLVDDGPTGLAMPPGANVPRSRPRCRQFRQRPPRRLAADRPPSLSGVCGAINPPLRPPV